MTSAGDPTTSAGEHGRPPGPPLDLAMGAFSDEPPWDMTGKELPWRQDMDAPLGHRPSGPPPAAASPPAPRP